MLQAYTPIYLRNKESRYICLDVKHQYSLSGTREWNCWLHDKYNSQRIRKCWNLNTANKHNTNPENQSWSTDTRKLIFSITTLTLFFSSLIFNIWRITNTTKVSLASVIVVYTYVLPLESVMLFLSVNSTLQQCVYENKV